MSRLTDVQIARTAKGAGFNGSGLLIAIAVCLAESDGDPKAVNITGNHPPSRDRGLWQINDYWHNEVSDADAFDPDKCARITFRISDKGTDWHQWATYNHDSYKKFMDRARAAVAALSPEPFRLRRLLRRGIDGEDVKLCQRIVGTKTDGDFGPLTESAVKSWQRSHHLSADGVVGPQTARSFGWAWAP